MNDNEDSVYVGGWMSRVDNDGREVTNEILGPGGARRDDGTLSSMVRDLEILETEESSCDPSDEDPPLPELLFTAGVSLAGGIAIGWTLPKVKQWWMESAQPELQKRKEERRRKKALSSESEALESLAPVEIELSGVVDESPGEGARTEVGSEPRE